LGNVQLAVVTAWCRRRSPLHGNRQWSGRNCLPLRLLAEARLHRDALASLGATPRNHRASALGFHTRPKSVRLRAATTVGLECALRHYETALLTDKKLNETNHKYIGCRPHTATRQRFGWRGKEPRQGISIWHRACRFCYEPE